ncbi:MAG: polysaccharide pyruvyl transferase family protein [Ruminococcaceae bacterium]|nr:polysaccharide pyruvyl transferase family protein [Oscillospiraceae bacterium]
MKTTAILTEHRARNHGSCLQAYALQESLRDLGYACEIIDYRPRAVEDTFGVFIKSLHRECGRNPKRLAMFYANTLLFSPLRIRREWKFARYRKEMYRLSRRHFETLTPALAKELTYDAYVCGSDQIWNPRITKGMDPLYFAAPFDPQARKVSYAASIGLSALEEKDAADLVRLLEPMDTVTVREPSAQRLIASLCDKPVEVVLDPTLLIDPTRWQQLITTRRPVNKDYILVYSLKVDDHMIAYANRLSRETGLPVLFFDLRRRYGKHSISKYTADPIEFLRYLQDARYVVTNSFHGTVFSVLFQKQFVCVPMEGTSSRMVDLLEKVGLSHRLLGDDLDIDAPIDYRPVQAILEAERQRCRRLLQEAIG